MNIFELPNAELIIHFILLIIKLKDVTIQALTVNGRIMTFPYHLRIATSVV